MKIHITHRQLQQIKDAATEKFKSSHNQAISSELFPALCILLAFQDFVNRGQNADNRLEISHPVPAYHEPVDAD